MHWPKYSASMQTLKFPSFELFWIHYIILTKPKYPICNEQLETNWKKISTICYRATSSTKLQVNEPAKHSYCIHMCGADDEGELWVRETTMYNPNSAVSPCCPTRQTYKCRTIFHGTRRMSLWWTTYACFWWNSDSMREDHPPYVVLQGDDGGRMMITRKVICYLNGIGMGKIVH